MRERFEVYSIGLDGRYGVLDTTLPKENDERIIVTVDREARARILVDKLNELQKETESKPLDLHIDFKEYDKLIKCLDKTNRRLSEIDEIYKEESKIVLQQAIEDQVDFKKIYGGNTEKTRKQYVDEQLSDLLDEKKELKFLQSDDLRRIEFLKRIIDMKIQMLRIGVTDGA